MLYEVSYDNDFDLSQSLRAIASYNRRHREVIQVFYEPFLQKLKTVLRLQNWIKGVLFRRRQKPIFVARPNGERVLGNSLVGRPITLENTLHVHYILLSRVAGKLQRVWRWRCLRMRTMTLAKIARYVSKIDSA